MTIDIIKKVTIVNFRCFEKEICFDFEGNRFVFLTAPNGTGKTSLMDAIEWCLTGSVS